METTLNIITEGTRSLTAAEQLTKELKFESRLLGSKDAYIEVESDNDYAFYTDTFFNIPALDRSAYRLKVSFEDKSTVYFKLCINNKKFSPEYHANYLVQDMVNILKVERVIWSIEGFKSVHFTQPKLVALRPGSILDKMKNFKRTVNEFFTFDDEY